MPDGRSTAIELSRQDAAIYVGHTLGTLNVYHCTKQVDLKPRRDKRGRYWYSRKTLDEYNLRKFKP